MKEEKSYENPIEDKQTSQIDDKNEHKTNCVDPIIKKDDNDMNDVDDLSTVNNLFDGQKLNFNNICKNDNTTNSQN